MIKKGIRIGAETGQLNISRFARLRLCFANAPVLAKASRVCTFRFREKQKADGKFHLPFVWCGKRDLNPYGVNHTPLKRARLPVPPLSHM